MSRKIETATSGAEFIQIARQSPNLKAERWAGSHWQGSTDQGRVTIANHNRELPPFLRVKIRRELIALGLACLFIMWAVSSLV